MRRSPASSGVSTEGAAATVRRTLVGPVVVAGEDSHTVEGALRVAQLLARRDRVNAHVLTVVRPLKLPASIFAAADQDEWEDVRRQQQLAAVRRRLHQTVGQTAHFSLSAESGSPAPAIARVARERGAELILVGIDAHGGPHRVETADAALQVTRTADVPVVAVPPDVALLPRRALVATDFSEASARAARAAVLMLTAGGTLTLAHVAPDVDFKAMGEEGWGHIYERGVAALLEQLANELRIPGDVNVETVVMHGDPAEDLLGLAARGAFELVAAGSQTAPWVEWHLTGSVSTRLLRGSRCTVLIAPPAESRG